MDLNARIASACEAVPGLVRAAVALVPDGLLIGGLGATSSWEHEPLLRSAMACLAAQGSPSISVNPASFVEYLFVVEDQLIVIQCGRRDPRLALVAVCTREPNLAFVLSTTRRAIAALEECIDLAELGV